MKADIGGLMNRRYSAQLAAYWKAREAALAEALQGPCAPGFVPVGVVLFSRARSMCSLSAMYHQHWFSPGTGVWLGH
jgi:hypothetical protein